jgi:hypothetical protein
MLAPHQASCGIPQPPLGKTSIVPG